MKRTRFTQAILPLLSLVLLAGVLSFLAVPMPTVVYAQLAEHTATPGGSSQPPHGGGGCNVCNVPVPTETPNPLAGQPSICALVNLNVRASGNIKARILNVLDKSYCATYAGPKPLPDPLPDWVEVVFLDRFGEIRGFVATRDSDPNSPYFGQKYVEVVPQ